MPSQGGVTGDVELIVTMTVTNEATGASTSDSQCFPVNPFVQFFEERPVVNGYLSQNPKFGTHDFWGAIISTSGKVALNSGSNTWKMLLYYSGTELVSSTTLSNGAHGSTWSDTWDSSYYP